MKVGAGGEQSPGKLNRTTDQADERIHDLFESTIVEDEAAALI